MDSVDGAVNNVQSGVKKVFDQVNPMSGAGRRNLAIVSALALTGVVAASAGATLPLATTSGSVFTTIPAASAANAAATTAPTVWNAVGNAVLAYGEHAVNGAALLGGEALDFVTQTNWSGALDALSGPN